MLQDGYWKRDIRKLRRQLSFWSRFGVYFSRDYAIHIMNRCFLFPSAIIRKIEEDEAEAKKVLEKTDLMLPAFKVLNYKVQVIKYIYIGNNSFYSSSKPNLADYDQNSIEKMELTLREICNQFIHSYIWTAILSDKKRELYGAMFAKDYDRGKCAYLLKIDDWLKALRFVSDNCNIYSK